MITAFLYFSACTPECGGIHGAACVDMSPTERPEDTGPAPHLRTSSTSGWTAIASGFWHTCGIDATGLTQCWGFDGDGQIQPPEDWTFAALSASWFSTCGLTPNGGFTCWGYTATMPVGTTRYTQVASGAYAECALSTAFESNVSCSFWGPDEDDHGQALAPSGTFVAVSTGRANTCAIDGAGALICWGAGTGDGGMLDFGQSLPPQGAFVSVTVGDQHACALDGAGSASCWGDNSAEQASPPTTMKPGTKLTSAVTSTFRSQLRTKSIFRWWRKIAHL